MENNCVSCNNKLNFIRYKPKSNWNIDGELCKPCFDQKLREMPTNFIKKADKYQKYSMFGSKGKWISLGLGLTVIIALIISLSI